LKKLTTLVIKFQMSLPLLSIILPTFNERQNIIPLYDEIKKHIEHLDIQYEIIFVDDNSPDMTIEEIRSLSAKDENVKYILMSRRFGDQISLMAGLQHASGDMVIVMDSDLQHPPKYIPIMVKKWEAGTQIVIMKREEEGHNSWFKKWTEITFYKLLQKMSNTPIFFRFSGFALLDQKVVQKLCLFEENEPFVRGLIGFVGYQKMEIPYSEDSRIFGRSKYNIFSLFDLALSGITSFSEKPLYVALYTGIFATAIALFHAFYVLWDRIFGDIPEHGWATTIIVITFLGGIQLISIGIIGIYLSKIFLETKKRPRYIIAEINI